MSLFRHILMNGRQARPDNPGEDYQALYEQAQKALIETQNQLKSVTAERDQLKIKLEQIKSIAGA